MRSIAVLGAGQVGSAIAKDLAVSHKIIVVDRSETALQRLSGHANISTRTFDLAAAGGLDDIVRAADLVVSAVPGHLGFDTLKRLIEAGKPVVDIAFAPENALELDTLARENRVPAIVDFGVAPGMDNVLLGHEDARMQIEKFECLVGGLPLERKKPFEYKAPFSPIDVVEEYTRPARLMIDGKIVTRPALTDVERIDFPGVGTLEAFNTDGLRSLLDTMSHVPNMTEKTLRYPGHVQLIQDLKDAGFFSTQPIEVGDTTVSPIAFTAARLIDAWRLEPGEKELTVMRVTMTGISEGERQTVRYELLDFFDEDTGTSSMARTTGYACTAAVGLILEGLWTRTGVSPPEHIGGSPRCFEYVMRHLVDRGIVYNKHIAQS